MRVLLAAAALLSACTSSSPAADDPPVLTTVGLVVDHQAGAGRTPLRMSESAPQALGPATLRLHDGRTLSAPATVDVRGWCWELGGRPGLDKARQCYLGFALAADGRTIEAATPLSGTRGRGDGLVRLRDQDRFVAEMLTVEGTWRRTAAGVAFLDVPGRAAFRLAPDVRVECVQQESPEELRDGAFVSATVDRASAQLTSISCLYSD